MARKRSHPLSGTPVAEGVQFEFGDVTACAVRDERRDIAVLVERQPHFFRDLFGRVPLVRGVVRLFSTVARFFSGLNRSAGMEPQQAVRGSAGARRFAGLVRTTPQALWALLSGLLIAPILAAAMLGLPWLAERILSAVGDVPRFAVNAVCCAFRAAGLVLGVWAVSRLKVLNRLCMYRGAANKVVNAYEAYGPNFSHEDAVLSSRLADKSDGVFLLISAMLAIVLFACVRVDGWALQLAFRVGGLLAAAAVADELILPLENAGPEGLGAALRKPLTFLQQMFSMEPHNQMLEVAVCAFRAACDSRLQ